MVTRNFWIGAIVILVVAAGIWSLYRTYQNQVQRADQRLASPAPSPIEKFPDADTSPFPAPAGFTQPATGITPQTLPATGGN